MYKRTSNPDEVRFCCPMCGDTKFHLYINIRKKVGLCFRCSYIVTSNEAERYCSYITPTYEYPVERKPVIRVLPGVPITEVPKSEELLKQHHKDKFSVSDLASFGVRVDGTSLVIPVYDELGVYRGYVRRNLTEPKYQNFVESSKVVFNLKPCRKIVLVEGAFDAMWVSKLGVHVGAIFGHMVGDYQTLCLLKAGVRHIILLLDSDVKLSELLRTYKKLSKNFIVEFAILEHGDPYDNDLEYIKRRILRPQSVEELITISLKEGLCLRS